MNLSEMRQGKHRPVFKFRCVVVLTILGLSDGSKVGVTAEPVEDCGATPCPASLGKQVANKTTIGSKARHQTVNLAVSLDKPFTHPPSAMIDPAGF